MRGVSIVPNYGVGATTAPPLRSCARGGRERAAAACIAVARESRRRGLRRGWGWAVALGRAGGGGKGGRGRPHQPAPSAAPHAAARAASWPASAGCAAWRGPVHTREQRAGRAQARGILPTDASTLTLLPRPLLVRAWTFRSEADTMVDASLRNVHAAGGGGGRLLTRRECGTTKLAGTADSV